MECVTQTLWPGHRITWIFVNHWIVPYRFFNSIFARARWPHEYSIMPMTKRDECLAIGRGG